MNLIFKNRAVDRAANVAKRIHDKVATPVVFNVWDMTFDFRLQPDQVLDNMKDQVDELR